MNLYNTSVHFIKISEDFSKQRIDNFLFFYLKKVPKSKVYCIIRRGDVRVNKKRVKFQYRLKSGDLLRIPPIQRVKKICFPKNCKEEIRFLYKIIIYEDDYLLVLNKPSGIAVHGGSGLKFGIIEGLRILRPEIQFLELVHRLDRDTSGVLLIAKNRIALLFLHEQLRSQKIQKEYLALVSGRWNVYTHLISIPLLKKNILYKYCSNTYTNLNVGKSAVTYFQIKEYFKDIATLLIIKPMTGRTHQIRIHTQYANHPIIGDRIYGNDYINMYFQKLGLNRLFLHAARLRFIHPNTKKVLNVQASIDQSFRDCLYFLKNY